MPPGQFQEPDWADCLYLLNQAMDALYSAEARALAWERAAKEYWEKLAEAIAAIPVPEWFASGGTHGAWPNGLRQAADPAPPPADPAVREG